jgi:uncharacterized protein (TIGR03000 family)
MGSDSCEDFLELLDGSHPQHPCRRSRSAYALSDLVDRQPLQVAKVDDLATIGGELGRATGSARHWFCTIRSPENGGHGGCHALRFPCKGVTSMKRRALRFGVPCLAMAALFLLPSLSQAQMMTNPNGNQSYVRLQVPADAEVWFDGQKTQSTGPDRLYVTPPLDRSKSYSYEVKARWMENGQPVERTRTVNIQAGTETRESFLGQSGEQPRRDSSAITDEKGTRPVGRESDKSTAPETKPADKNRAKPTDENRSKPADENRTKPTDENRTKLPDENRAKPTDENRSKPADENRPKRPSER